MKISGRRSDGALHLSLGGGVSVIMKHGYVSPPLDESTVAKLGPWHLATTLDVDARRRVEARLDRCRMVPVHNLAKTEQVICADDGMWSCPGCGAENTGPLAGGCAKCGMKPNAKAEPVALSGTSEGAKLGWENRGGGGDSKKGGSLGKSHGDAMAGEAHESGSAERTFKNPDHAVQLFEQSHAALEKAGYKPEKSEQAVPGRDARASFVHAGTGAKATLTKNIRTEWDSSKGRVQNGVEHHDVSLRIKRIG